jgi:hypothetical protein
MNTTTTMMRTMTTAPIAIVALGGNDGGNLSSRRSISIR